MIKSLTVINSAGDSLDVELAFPEKSGFAITKIEGLGTPKADIQLTDLPSGDGSMFNSAKVGTRNIVIDVEYLWSPTIEKSRLITYKYFMPKDQIELFIKTDSRYVQIKGIVESNEPNIFDKNSGGQISVICPDPYFYSAVDGGNSIISFSNVIPNFEFPFSNTNDEAQVDNPLLEMSIYELNREQNVFYTGEVPVGITIAMHIIGDVKNINIVNTHTRENIFIKTDIVTKIAGEPLSAGDDIVITTEQYHKKAILYKKGKTYNILNAIGRPPDWFKLRPGDNLFSYTTDIGDNNIQFRIGHRTIYMGV